MVAPHGVCEPSANAHHQQRRQRQARPEAGAAAAGTALQQAASGQQLHAAGEPRAPAATLTAGSRMVSGAGADASSRPRLQPLATAKRCCAHLGQQRSVTLTALVWQIGPGSQRCRSACQQRWDETRGFVDTSTSAALADEVCPRRGSYIDVCMTSTSPHALGKRKY